MILPFALVIFLVRQNVSDDDHGDSVLDFGDRPYFVAADVENRSSAHGVRGRESLFQLHNVPEVRFLNQLLPTPQTAPRIRVLPDEILNKVRAQQSHQKVYSKLRYKGNTIIASCDTQVAAFSVSSLSGSPPQMHPVKFITDVVLNVCEKNGPRS